MKRLMFLVAALVPACALDTETNTDDLDSQDHGSPEPRAAGIHWAKDAKPGGGGGASDPHLIYHGGPIMAAGAVPVEPIFWGTSWSTPGDKITGVQSFYTGMGGTSYDATNSEYTQTGGQHVGSVVSLGVSHTDLSAAPKSGSRTGPILAEV